MILPKTGLANNYLWLLNMYLNRNMRFPTMWYVRPAEPQISLCLSLEYSMTVKLLTEHHLEFLSLRIGCRGSSVTTCHIVGNTCHGSLLILKFYFILANSADRNETPHSGAFHLGEQKYKKFWKEIYDRVCTSIRGI